MKKLFLAGLAVMGLAACGASPKQLCGDMANTLCQRAFECADATTKASAGFIGVYGANESECKTKWNSTMCANVTDDKPCTDSSKKYNASKASACIDDYKKASCETLNGGTFTSGNCNSVCE